MNLLSADIIERFYLFLWPMTRISAMLLTTPPFSTASLNVRIRILLAVVLTWMIYPLHDWPRIDPTSAQGLLELLNQIFIGVCMGLIMQVVVAALVLAGQALSAAMGLSMATMVDPNIGNAPVLSQFVVIMSTLIFVGTGGHAVLIGLILESFYSLPIGTSILNQDTYAQVIRWSSMMFLGGLLLTLPVMITLLFINIGLGVVTRAAPSLNIFSVGFPAMIVAGLLIFMLSLESVGGRIEWLWLQGFDVVRSVLKVP